MLAVALLCVETVADRTHLTPGRMVHRLLDTTAASIQQQQANTHGSGSDNVSSDPRSPLQRAIAATLAAIAAPTTVSDPVDPAGAGAAAAATATAQAAAVTSPPSSPIPLLLSPASRVSVSVAEPSPHAPSAEAIYAVSAKETGLAVEHIILGLLFVGIVFFIIDCCGPELSRMFGCRRSRRRLAAKGGG